MLERIAPENRLDSAARFRMLQLIMKKRFWAKSLAAIGVTFAGVILLGTAGPVSAHERDTFKIGDKYYVLTVGSLNEPFVVDNISGVDLRAAQLAGAPSGSTGKGTPVTGLERTLKVELSAGAKKQTLSFDPSDEAPGAYAANFIPTVQTTYTYRIFGTVNGAPVDLTFACVTGEV